MSNDITESFKTDKATSDMLPHLAKMSGFEGKSEYIRHLILSDINARLEQAEMYRELLVMAESLPSNTK